MPSFASIPRGWEKWLLDLVGIATVADMVPLTGENRALAHFGLHVLRRSNRSGILALCSLLRLKQQELTEDDIGFSIAPRINAASRMDEPEIAFRLLTTKDKMEAEKCAAHLEELNASRKGVVSGIVRSAKKHVKERFTAADPVVVVGDPSWKPALLGLAANSIMNERGGVVCVWGRDANGTIKGSCRSDGSVSLIELYKEAGDIFVEAGGHEKSGGFSVSHERIHSLPETLLDAARKLAKEKKEIGRRDIDADLSLPELTFTLYREVSRLRPFGIGNPKPVFRISRTSIASVRRFGKENNHVEIQISDGNGTRVRAFEFFKGPEQFTLVPAADTSADVIATIERDTFRGGLSLRIVDIVASS
jgi:single-stranded-DNA-specific exonuclease